MEIIKLYNIAEEGGVTVGFFPLKETKGVYIECDGNTVVYERHKPGVGSFTKKTMLDLFIMDTEIEGIAWEVYSTEEYPDLSYILLISGTNSSWTFRISEQTP